MKNALFKFVDSLLSLCSHVRAAIRRRVITSTFKKVGKNFIFSPDSVFVRPETISIGDNVFIARNAHISSQDILIGNNVMIGPNILMECDDHIFDQVGVLMREISHQRKAGRIEVEDDVWIGGNVTILKDVTIGTGSVVGANSLVTKSLPPFSICVGIPCRPKKKRFDDDVLRVHLKKLNFPEGRINDIIEKRNEYFKSKG